MTFYVHPSRFEAVRAFYAELSGTAPVWEDPGHIACFGTVDLAICVHEEEPGHPAGATELFFWIGDLDGDGELQLVDPLGNQVRLHRRRP